MEEHRGARGEGRELSSVTSVFSKGANCINTAASVSSVPVPAGWGVCETRRRPVRTASYPVPLAYNGLSHTHSTSPLYRDKHVYTL